ncbi:MAG: hypothetical protein ACC628_03035 [Pirellulaceae bacterium]
MDRSAQVTSIDAVRELRTALLQFEAGARDAVSMLQLEVRRAVDWLENDRGRYWPNQVRKASEGVAQARNALGRAELTYGSEEPPPCTEQKKALAQAKRRLRLCEEKVKTVRRWVRAVRAELNEFDGQMARMNNYLDTDTPRATAALERMLRALEKYVQSTQPAVHRPEPSSPAGTRDAGRAPADSQTASDGEKTP